MMNNRFFAVLALVIGLCLIVGCNSKKARAMSAAEAIKTAPATMEEVFNGKTPGGKPVRAYKIVLKAPQGEHLLLVVGDASVPVSMKNASTVKIGTQTFSDTMYLPIGNGQVFAVKTSGSQGLAMPFETEFLDKLAPPPDPQVKLTFPMPLFKAKISGQTLKLPGLDTL
jgi:hypothetical protein